MLIVSKTPGDTEIGQTDPLKLADTTKDKNRMGY